MKQPNVKVTKKKGFSTAKTKSVKALRFNNCETEIETEIYFEWIQLVDDDEGSLPVCSLKIKEDGKRAAEYILEPEDLAKLIKLSKLCPFKAAEGPMYLAKH